MFLQISYKYYEHRSNSYQDIIGRYRAYLAFIEYKNSTFYNFKFSDIEVRLNLICLIKLLLLYIYWYLYFLNYTIFD